ncbi:hypothetical protein BDN70DRAFT_938908 [Pholiota conissans]|uniref:Uncharacterized protein n=1 Tax=Pholiota conissans TaxID=109636 RepID=A0A9P6CSW2_9AGAR|nr:hypothetical protein BDN70DRAFT_938908 [Pholiota conissans]
MDGIFAIAFGLGLNSVVRGSASGPRAAGSRAEPSFGGGFGRPAQEVSDTDLKFVHDKAWNEFQQLRYFVGNGAARNASRSLLVV